MHCFMNVWIQPYQPLGQNKKIFHMGDHSNSWSMRIIVHHIHVQKTIARPFGHKKSQTVRSLVYTWGHCQISWEELSHPLKQRRDDLRKWNICVSLPLLRRLHISLDSSTERRWPAKLGTIQDECGYHLFHLIIANYHWTVALHFTTTLI